MEITKSQIMQWIAACAAKFKQHQQWQSELDTAIGDGDHGLNMQRGFTKVMEKLPEVADKDIGTIMKTTGMTLLSSVGGASGPLFGALFMKMAQSTAGKQFLTFTEFSQALQDGVNGIVARGKAAIGDKTMCDVWLPVAAQLSADQDLAQAVAVAQRQLESTIALQAKKGRASYLGERSIGHQDPGATSAALMIEALHVDIHG